MALSTYANTAKPLESVNINLENRFRALSAKKVGGDTELKE